MSKKILPIDDNVDLITVFGRMLQRRGFDVATATSVPQALEFVKDTLFDVVISDLVLPHESGFNFIEAFRKTSTVPVIALTGWAQQESREQALAAGFCDFLPKPVLIDDLIAAINRCS